MIERNARDLARAVRDGRNITVALRHLNTHRSEPETVVLATALARFLVDRCQTQHEGWRTIRRIVEESPARPPWEKCARRAVTQVTDDLLKPRTSHTRLPAARQLAARCQAEQIASHVDSPMLLADLGLRAYDVPPARWREALGSAVTARSRQQVAQRLESALSTAPPV